MIIKNCIQCNKEFIKIGAKKFCSRDCHNDSRRGKPQNIEHIKKRSEALKKAYSNPKLREKLTEARKKQWENGYKGSTGHHWKKTPEQLANKMGAKNPAWKGGITPINTKIRNSQEYAEWRISVFKRDDYTCQICGIRGSELHADHIKPFSQFPELRLDINNGRALCVPCHRKTDTFAGRSRDYSLTISFKIT